MSDLLSSDPRVATLVDSIADIVIAPLQARVKLLEAQLATTLAAHDALFEAAKPFVREGEGVGDGWDNIRDRNTVQPSVKPNTMGDYRALCKAFRLSAEARQATGPKQDSGTGAK